MSTILRNSGGTVSGIMLTGRQLREQTDLDNDLTYQFEPVWKFRTGTVFHTLLTGAEVEWQSIDDQRATADLPNITNIFAPVIPETSTAGLAFLRDAKHSGMVDDLRALYLGAYASDQIDVTEQWKVRFGVRQDHWFEQLTPLAFRARPCRRGRYSDRARHGPDPHRSAGELERRHAVQDSAGRRPVCRRGKKLSDQFQLGSDITGAGRAGIRASNTKPA